MSNEKSIVLLPANPTENGKIENEKSSTQTITGPAEDGKFDSVSTMGDLKEKAPEVYRMMMNGIAMNICHDMREHQRRFRDILRKARDNNR